MSALLGVSREAAASRPTEPAELTRDLYERYGQRVFTFCYSRLRNREAAQDAAQTTFIYVLRALQRGVVPEFELAWVLKIAFNVCRGARRSAGRETSAMHDVEDIDTLAAPEAAGLEGSQRLTALRDGLASLPDNQRRGILLREWQGLSYAEIADELGLTVGAVETLLFRARRNLAARLQDVRSGVGAFDIASFATVLRSAWRGALLKLGFIGAAASIALVPVVATEVAPALADKQRDVKLPSLRHPAGLSARPPTRPAQLATAIPSAAQERAASTAPAAPSSLQSVHDLAAPVSEPAPASVAPPATPAASPALASDAAATPPSAAPPVSADPPAITPPPLSLPQVTVPQTSGLAPVDSLLGTVDSVSGLLP